MLTRGPLVRILRQAGTGIAVNETASNPGVRIELLDAGNDEIEFATNAFKRQRARRFANSHREPNGPDSRT